MSALRVLATLACQHALRGETQAIRWAVPDFLRPSGVASDYGKAAARAVASAMRETIANRVVDLDRVRRSASALGFSPPRMGLTATISIGEDVGAGVVKRGMQTLDWAKIEATEPDQAEIVPRRILDTIAPRDRVWPVLDFPLERLHVRRASSRVLHIERGVRATG